MSSLASLTIAAAFARYLQNAGTSLATGFLVEFGDGTQTGLWLDSDGIGFKNNGYVTSFRCAAAAAQTLTFNYTASKGMVYPELVAVLATSATNSTTTPAAVTATDANFKIAKESLAVSSVYEFEMTLLFGTAATTTAPQFTITGPSETTLVSYMVQSPPNVATIGSIQTCLGQAFTAFGSAFANNNNMPSTTGYFPFRVRGIMKTSSSAATSDISVSITSEVGSSAITLAAGSVMRFRKLT
jgi:hypothetical protein